MSPSLVQGITVILKIQKSKKSFVLLHLITRNINSYNSLNLLALGRTTTIHFVPVVKIFLFAY
jgi:hypothetical protein